MSTEVGKIHYDLDLKTKAFDKVSSQVSSKLKSIGDKMGDLGKEMSLKVTAPIVAIGGAAVMMASQIDNAKSTIAKATGATGKDLEGMADIARRVGVNVPQSFDEVGTAIGEIATRLNLTGDELETTSEMFLDFARINNMEVGPAVRGVSRFMQDWGIDTKDTNKILDQMTAVAQATGVSIEQLTTIGVRYGVQLRALGFSQTESLALMGKWEKEGVSTEKMVAGLSIALGRLKHLRKLSKG